jgi:hypothetical protein
MVKSAAANRAVGLKFRIKSNSISKKLNENQSRKNKGTKSPIIHSRLKKGSIEKKCSLDKRETLVQKKGMIN